MANKKTLAIVTFFFLLAFIFKVTAQGIQYNIDPILVPTKIDALPFSKQTIARIKEQEPIIEANIETFFENKEKKQRLSFKGAGIHKKTCMQMLRRLSIYENYKNIVPFVKKSDYDDTLKRIDLLFDSKIFPIPIGLNFKIPRIRYPGIYHFEFDRGFLIDLKGEIQISNYNNNCLVFVNANWQGPYSGFSDTVFNLFTVTGARIAINSLLRHSEGN